MLNLQAQHADLGRTEACISKAEVRITQQGALVERLRIEGRNTRSSEMLLHTLEGLLEVWRWRRKELLRTIAVLETRNKPTQGHRRT